MVAYAKQNWISNNRYLSIHNFYSVYSTSSSSFTLFLALECFVVVLISAAHSVWTCQFKDGAFSILKCKVVHSFS